MTNDEPWDWEYEVAWFPQNGPDQTRAGLTEAAARKLADKHAESVPIIYRRKIVITEWEMVENYIDRDQP
jgi:hypothetical protein